MSRLAIPCLAAGLAVVGATSVLAQPSQGQAQSCRPITSVPYTIATPGKYCLAGHLQTPITSGSAITINADSVVLDLNGFTLSGVSSSMTSFANGILAGPHRSVTVRNGTVTGFMRGVSIQGDFPNMTAAVGAVVESMRVVDCTYEGIRVENRGAVIRDNHVVNITNSPNPTIGGNGVSVGIGAYGKGNRLLNNDILDVVGIAGSESYGINLNACDQCVVEANRVVNSADHVSYGIEGGFSSGVMVVGNRVGNFQVGITAYTPTGILYTDNVTFGCDTPYGSGVNAGNNR